MTIRRIIFNSFGKLAFAAAFVFALAAPAALANDNLWNPEFGSRFMPGLYPGSKSASYTATATGSGATGTATLNGLLGQITTPSLTTAAGATYTLTLTNSSITASDLLIPIVGNGTNTGGTPNMANATLSAGQAVITVQNIHASAAFNGTVVIGFYLLKTEYAQ